MTLRTLLRFQNPDSTQDINDRTRGLFNKGVFSGGDVEAIASTLTVRLTPFATLGFDGMFVREDDDNNILSVEDGVRNYIVVRQRYVASADPIVSVESLTESEFNGDADPDALIVFAVVDVPVSATSVLQSYIEFFERDVIDPLGRLSFRGVLENTGLLPPSSTNANRAGDFYVITDGSGGFPEIWSWNGSGWVNITQAQTMISLLDTHRDNLDVDRVHVTSLQFDALLGTTGTPSSSNKYVTSLDPRIPTQDENDALQADPSILSEFAPSETNRYINSSKIFAVPASTDFVGGAFIELTDANGPYFVGNGAIGTAQNFFNIYGRDATTLEDDDQELLNSEFQPVRITGIFTEASLSVELNPAVSADALGFTPAGFGSLFVQVSNAADEDFTISYGLRTLLGDMLPEVFLLRGPQFGQVDARVRQILESSVNGQFDDSAWDGAVVAGNVVAFDIGLNKFIQADIAGGKFPVGVRGNTNNLIAEGLYEFSATAFSAGDQVYAHNTVLGALSTVVNDRFIGTFFDSTRLLVNMNSFGISASTFVPGVAFPGGLFDGSLLSGEVAAFNTSTGLFEQWDDSIPSTPAPDGLRGNSNNIIQVGRYQAGGAPYIAGTRFYGSTASNGQLTTTPNDFFVAHAITSDELLVNVTGSANWEDARDQFDVEHVSTSGIHSEGSSRTFVGLAGDAGIATSNSLASSTGMTLFATDTGQVFYCTDGAANTWVEASRFSGPLEITNSLEVGGNLILPTGILDDDAGDTFNVFSHAIRHLASGADPISGVISQIFADGEDGGGTVVLTGSFADVLSTGFDFTGRGGDSTILIFGAVQCLATSGTPTEYEYQITLDGVPLASPSGVIFINNITDATREATSPIQGFVNTVANGAGTVAIQARNHSGSNTFNRGHLLVLDLGPN